MNGAFKSRKDRKNRKYRPPSRVLSIESLEDRRVMAAVSLVNGVLTLTGDNVADDIRVNYNGENVNSLAYVADRVTGVIKASLAFNTAAVTQVNINALGGDDNVQYNLIAPSYIHAGEGNDIVYGNEGVDHIYGEGGNNTLYGKGGNDFVFGGEADDYLDTGNGVDYGFGYGGNDTLVVGGYGEDSLHGGEGGDTYLFMGSASSGRARLYEESSGKGDTLDFHLKSQAATVQLNLQAYQTVVPGTELLIGSGTFESVIGTPYDDTLIGNSLSNFLDGGKGNDRLEGLEGDDILFGGEGKDSLFGGQGLDVLEGGQGDDTLEGNEGDDLYVFRATIGGLGLDTIVEVANQDSDTLSFAGIGRGLNLSLATTNVQIAVYDFLALRLSSATGIENVSGTLYDDVITGNARANSLWGLAGNDKLVAGAGDDRLFGGSGDDFLDGGADSDYYIFGSGGGSQGSDVIDDSSAFNGLDFTMSDRGITLDLNKSSKQTVNSAFSLTLKKPANITAVYGSEFNDYIYGNDRDNFIDARGGDDWVWGGKGNDTLYGGAGVDRLFGEAGNDYLYADLVDAVVDGGTGTNKIYGRKSVPIF